MIKITWKQHATAAFVAIALFAPMLWMILDRQEPYVRVFGEIHPMSPKPGDFVEVDWKLKVIRYCPPASRRNVSRRVIDSTGKVHTYDNVEGVFGANREAPRDVVRGFQLPYDAAPGPARYESSACFACNPTQHIPGMALCVDQPPIYFHIMPK